MREVELNCLTAGIRDHCRDNLLGEKWLLAPSLRIGFQWLDRVTRSGQPVLNARVKTLRSMALEVASPRMETEGLSYISGLREVMILGRILGRFGSGRGGYLAALQTSPGLIETVHLSIRDLRLSGEKAGTLNAGEFEVALKGEEMIAVLGQFERQLREGKLVDYASVLEIASERLNKDRSIIPEDTVVLVPDDLVEGLKGLERAFLEQVPAGNRSVLAVDMPGAEPERGLTDAELLGWVLEPGEAPAPHSDGTAEMVRVVGEVNEVREVFRRCLESGVPFDDVELLHTDSSTYVPLVFELASRIGEEGPGTVPVTFSEGVPVRYSRPGKALAGWLSWISEDYSQSALARMLSEGLLVVDEVETSDISYSFLGAMLRALPIGYGRDRYLDVLDRKLRILRGRLSASRGDGDDGDIDEQGHERSLIRERGMKAVRGLVVDLLEFSGDREVGQIAFLEGASKFLQTRVRSISEFDEYSRGRLLEEMAEMVECLEDGDVPGFDVQRWLLDMAGDTHVLGRGPRPGCLYVAPVGIGGHSGRGHTFVVGLDDTRFPGAGQQDPLLLDHERGRISGELTTAAGRMTERLEEFAMLLSSLRGKVTLSYCCLDLVDDREMFPGPLFLSAYRVLSGEREGDHRSLLEWLPDPVSFAPGETAGSLDISEWWLERMCRPGEVENPKEILAAHFPHLGRGLKARAERESDRFTEFDGFVPEAGREFDPCAPGGLVLSANRLERLGACPMEFFFKDVLGVEPPEEYGVDPSVWLDPLGKGNLLHEVFKRFVVELTEQGKLPVFERDLALLERILAEEIERKKRQVPPLSADVFERERAELHRTIQIFLREEEEFCRDSKPLCCEAAIGLPYDGDGTFLCTAEPVQVELPDGRSVYARGRIDRIDELVIEGERRITVWDYKTGSGWGYERDKPFRGGRRVQCSLYLALVESRLREVLSEATVELFGLFFPSQTRHGDRMQWSRERLSDGMDVLGLLCDMLAGGCFPFTDQPQDVNFSDYREAFGDPEGTAEQVNRKLENPENKVLRPFRELREGW